MTTGMAALALPSFINLKAAERNTPEMKSKSNMKIGIITGLDNPRENIKRVRDFGFNACQVSAGEFTPGIEYKKRYDKGR